jgi:hypothetical protein
MKILAFFMKIFANCTHFTDFFYNGENCEAEISTQISFKKKAFTNFDIQAYGLRPTVLLVGGFIMVGTVFRYLASFSHNSKLFEAR